MQFAFKFMALLGLALAASKALAIPVAELKENYQPIIDRNPFGLKPPPPPATNNLPPPKEKPKTEIFLTGIVSIGYPKLPKQVYFMTKEQNKKEPTYYALTEGVEKDGIKVLNIDDALKKVKIHTDDGEVLLSFQTHGISAPAAPAVALPGQPGAHPPGQPGIPVPGQPNYGIPQPVQAQPLPVTQPNQNNMGGTAPTPIRQIPSRRIRGGADAGANFNPGVANPLPGAGPGGAEAQPQAQLDPAEQYVRMHLNRAAAEKQGMVQPPLPIIGQ